MSVKDAIRSPWHMAIFGAVIALISLGFAYFVFPESAGLLTVFLITIISAPFMWNLFKYEEWCEEKDFVCKMDFTMKYSPMQVFGRSSKIFLIYTAFFAGIVAALSVSYMLLPDNVAEKAFNDQKEQINKVNKLVGGFTLDSTFAQILKNNLVVLTISFIAALLLGGFGAVFILAWNASVLSAAIGIVGKMSGVSDALVRFMPHGVFEIAAYFIAVIAGGVISVALTKRHVEHFGPVMRDMVLLLVLGAILVLIGTVIETSNF